MQRTLLEGCELEEKTNVQGELNDRDKQIAKLLLDELDQAVSDKRGPVQQQLLRTMSAEEKSLHATLNRGTETTPRQVRQIEAE